MGWQQRTSHSNEPNRGGNYKIVKAWIHGYEAQYEVKYSCHLERHMCVEKP